MSRDNLILFMWVYSLKGLQECKKLIPQGNHPEHSRHSASNNLFKEQPIYSTM